jgi:Kdo2-lipid IVA lauroyltransferase/acyltransferase
LTVARTTKGRDAWSWPQRLKNDLLYGLMRFGFSAARVLPIRGPLRLLGCVAPHIFRSAARRAQRHLRAVMPQLDAAKTTRRMFVHFAESMWEISRLHRSVPDLDGPARQILDSALAEGMGAVMISGHIGNWELLGQAIAAAGYPIATIAKPSYDRRITQWMGEWRTVHGLQMVWRDEGNAGKTILRILRQNGLMAFLIDQNTKTAGDFVPFFGRPAFTPTIPAAIALRTGTPVIFCWHHRRQGRHKIGVERIQYTPSGDAKRDVMALTALFNERLESVIRSAPEQWVWLHTRWGRIAGS